MKKHPIFPLSIFLLPGEFSQLYIFEDRYKQLIKECFAQSKTFGIAYSGKLNPQNLGSMVKVVEISKEHPNGEMDIIVQGLGVFALERFYLQAPGKLYPAGDLKALNTALEDAIASDDLLILFRNYYANNEHPDPEQLWQPKVLISELTRGLFLSDFEKIEMVQIENPAALEKYLKNYLRYLKLLEEQEQNVYQNIYLN